MNEIEFVKKEEVLRYAPGTIWKDNLNYFYILCYDDFNYLFSAYSLRDGSVKTTSCRSAKDAVGDLEFVGKCRITVEQLN